MKKIMDRSLKWKCDLPQLFREVLCNEGAKVLVKPIQLTQSILVELSERCIELNDPILNELMCDLRLYETPSPATEEYSKFIKPIRRKASLERKKLIKVGKG